MKAICDPNNKYVKYYENFIENEKLAYENYISSIKIYKINNIEKTESDLLNHTELNIN